MSKSVPPVKGIPDLLPEHTAVWQHVEHVFRDVLSRYGYQEIRLPLLERTELFKRSIGDTTDIVEKEMFTFDTQGGTSVTLRPEGTAGCVRAGISNGLLHNQRQRVWYTGPMFRYEKPQAGRYRQFYQFGAEAFGFNGPDIDAEMILLLARVWRTLGLSRVTLKINTLGDKDSRERYRATLVDYFGAHEEALDSDSKRRLTSNPLRILDSKNPDLAALIAAAPSLIDSLDDESRAHFDGVRQRLDAAGLEYEVDPRLVRGLDYYSRTVFEWQTDALGAQNAICGGGRYDSLVAHMGGRATPALGFGVGLDRLVALLAACSATIPAAPRAVYVVSVGDAPAAAAQILAETLRDQPALRVICHGNEGGFKAQMKAADKSGADWALIVGEDETSRRVAGLKPLRGGEQIEVSWEDIPATMARELENRAN
ncbi:MAG: histidine--tRNA ligase [Gammaproteobacteria bacterium]